MAETLFPVRQRCRSCGRKLGADGAHVWLGLFCSAKCAGMAALPGDPSSSAVPRGCRTQRDGVWVWKKRYRSEQEIPARLREDPSTSWYWGTECCGGIHLGHTRMGEAEQFRMFREAGDLGDVLMKLRGAATRTEVATAAGIRPIRLKELEEGAERVDPKALFAVLRVLGADLGVSIRQDRRGRR